MIGTTCSLIVVCFASARIAEEPAGLDERVAVALPVLSLRLRLDHRPRARGPTLCRRVELRRLAITAGSNDVPCGAWCAPRRTPRSALRERVTIERPNIGWGRADVR